jgi:hypothetical protein
LRRNGRIKILFRDRFFFRQWCETLNVPIGSGQHGFCVCQLCLGLENVCALLRLGKI